MAMEPQNGATEGHVSAGRGAPGAADNTGSWEASRRQGRLPTRAARELSPADASALVFQPPGGDEGRTSVGLERPASGNLL